MEFISWIRPKRSDYLSTMTPVEQATIGHHMAYVKALFDEKKLFWAALPPMEQWGLSWTAWKLPKKPGDSVIRIPQSVQESGRQSCISSMPDISLHSKTHDALSQRYGNMMQNRLPVLDLDQKHEWTWVPPLPAWGLPARHRKNNTSLYC